MNGVLYRKEHSGEFLAENMEGCEVSEEIETHHIDIKVNMYLNRSYSVDDHYLVEGRFLDSKDTIIIMDGEDTNIEPPVITNIDEHVVKSKNGEQQIMKHKFPEEETTQFQVPYSFNEYFIFTDDDKPSQEHFKVGPEPLSETRIRDQFG
ncbi:unnamed protein product [Arctia plantaginis]|uniref:Uncharacterized protein n=1 Tax=Arctia plantaginis TaxID=874455 RepID=A0A8S0ZAK6_ARCPL|nr:unnamed protein product [Arctia plantaginis]